MSNCVTCGATIRWTETSQEEGGIVRVARIPLDTTQQIRPPKYEGKMYVLDPEDGERAVEVPGTNAPAYTDHRETCGQARRG